MLIVLVSHIKSMLSYYIATCITNYSSAGIFGLGAIGKHVARMAKSFDMKVIATKRNINPSDHQIENVDELLPTKEFDDLISQSDYLVLSCPLSDETRGIMNEGKLKKMKASLILLKTFLKNLITNTKNTTS